MIAKEKKHAGDCGHTINAAIGTLAKAFSDRGLKDGVQVNSVLPQVRL
jgi:hypothetical protein